MIRRQALVMLLATLVLAGCQGGAAPVTKPAPKPPTVDPSPTPSEPAPAVSAPAPVDPPACSGPITYGPIRVYLDVGEVQTELPPASCRLTVSAGTVAFALPVPARAGGKPQITVSGATGAWDGDYYRATLTLEPSKISTVTFDLSDVIGRPNSVTYTLTGGPPAAPFLAFAPARNGPWTPVPVGGFMPPDAAWLRMTYPLDMKPDGLSPVKAEPYRMPGQGLPGEWGDSRTQYVDIRSAPPVLFVRDNENVTALPMHNTGLSTLYRGDPPELTAITPADGASRTLYRFTEKPEFIELGKGNVNYSALVGGHIAYRQFALTTGQMSTVAEPASDGLLRFPSPDGTLMAELTYPGGLPGHKRPDKPLIAHLIIREQSTGKTVLKQDNWISSWGDLGCRKPAPGFGWRADSKAVAVLDAPDQDHLVLKVTDLQGATRVIAETHRADVAYEQFQQQLSWSPSGAMIKAGDQVVDVASGKVVSEKLPLHGFWSPDSRYLLLYHTDLLFRTWGTVGLLEVSTGKRRDLGSGLALGWLSAGEALMVRWDMGRKIPPTPGDCI